MLHLRTLWNPHIILLVAVAKPLDRQARLSALRQLRGKVGFDLDLDRTRR